MAASGLGGRGCAGWRIWNPLQPSSHHHPTNDHETPPHGITRLDHRLCRPGLPGERRAGGDGDGEHALGAGPVAAAEFALGIQRPRLPPVSREHLRERPATSPLEFTSRSTRPGSTTCISTARRRPTTGGPMWPMTAMSASRETTMPGRGRTPATATTPPFPCCRATPSITVVRWTRGSGRTALQQP